MPKLAEETSVSLEQDDWYVTHTVRLEGPTRTLRVRLRRNAYDFQSTAVAEAINPDQGDLQWHVLYTLQPNQWVDQVPTVSAVRVGKATAADVEDQAMIVIARMLGYCSRLLGIG